MTYCLQCSSWWCQIPNKHPVVQSGHKEAWEKGSDYTRSGDSLWCDTTRGRVLISGKIEGLR